MIVKVFDDDGNEIGQCSNYEIKSQAPSGVNLNDDKKVPPPLEVSLTLKDWKTPIVSPPPAMDDSERRSVTGIIAMLVWMLGGRVELNLDLLLQTMDSKEVKTIRNIETIIIEVRDR